MYNTNMTAAKSYVQLAFNIDRHLDGYVDAYYGPPEWKGEEQDDLQPIDALRTSLDKLFERLYSDQGMDIHRKQFLTAQLDAMRATLDIIDGKDLSVIDEANALYQVHPTWIDESKFDEARYVLDSLLPSGSSLHQRIADYRSSCVVPPDALRQVVPRITEKLREYTGRLVELPSEETVKFDYVSSRPWAAYNWYRGNGSSLIEINTDLPMSIQRLVSLLGHEAYPGHHTELTLKDDLLFQGKGYFENSMVLIHSPGCLISEGLAERGLTLVTDDDFLEWQRSALYSVIGVHEIDPVNERQIDDATKVFTGVGSNAALMMYENAANDDEIVKYIVSQSIDTEEEARGTVSFLRNRLYRSYIFTYYWGGCLLDRHFDSTPDPKKSLISLLTQPTYPGMLSQ